MDVLVRWEGELSNARIREVFGVQAVQSSRLLATYMAERGSALSRATPRAPVKPSARFDDEVPPTSADDYLRLLAGAPPSLPGSDLIIDARPALLSENPRLFADLLNASRNGTGLQISYGSMNNPSGVQRSIFPHSLVRAPRRWHVRAWCDLRKDFRDFALGRVLSYSTLDEPAPKTRRHDADWNRFINLKVVAHPAFGDDHRRLLYREYFAGKSSMNLRVRKALASYVVQDLRLATDLGRDYPPQFQLYLENAESLSDLFSVGAIAS
ncbi:WYL domain-containing protein [Paucibacter sp. M5-1]|uniref:WYL domain-containing protein n=1 Tax=Paucibacter sp. M5-1 TaxID=3015998 RepID=UPI0022B8B9C8|nr:WYL domain-containing protein [Paucibacter sp. M5-1]MCZ7881558.1 WYL domain-containing protein [Paucibacter sp. M5-1]